MRAVLKAQINKTDRNDARGMAQMMRVGLYRPVHVKTLRSQKLRMLLTHRKLLQSKAIAIDNDLRGTLRNLGLKVGMVGTVRFEARIRKLVANLPDLAALIEPLLIVRRALREQFCNVGILHGTRCFSQWGTGLVRSHMLIRHTLLICSAAGLALCLASPVEAAKKHRKSTAADHSTLHRRGAVPGSVFQGGVLAGPLYNGQDYIGNDPDPNIRSYLIRDQTRYGGRD